MVSLTKEEAEALDALAARERRYPKQQAQLLIAQALVDAGLLDPELVAPRQDKPK